MRAKLKTVLKIVVPVIFWLLVWEIAAKIVDKSFFLPSIEETLKSLYTAALDKDFALTILSTILRVMFGLFIGTALGVLMAVLSHYSEIFKSIVAPFISVVKSTPVATFIIILWLFMSGEALPVFIAVLMVMPIIWQNVLDGYAAVAPELDEVCRIYNFSYIKRVRVLVFPTLLKYFIPAFITAAGLAWKSEIAAEVIAYTKNSIGGNISDANVNFDTPTAFAWTLVVIILSIIIEVLTKFLLSRFKKNAYN